MKNKSKACERIFIAGPPCSGKSTVGNCLAKMMSVPFIDLDHLIEERSGMSIPEMFGSLGEEAFRELESEMLMEITLGSDCFVMALGGGCLLREFNLHLINGRGVLVSLTASDEVLLERLEAQHATRPLAMSPMEMMKLLESRRSHYRSLPDPLDTTGMKPDDLAELLLERIRSLSR